MNKPLYKKIGDKVRTLRNQKGFTQAQLAEKADITPYYQGEIERGVKKVSVEVLFKISKALNLSLKDIFDFE